MTNFQKDCRFIRFMAQSVGSNAGKKLIQIDISSDTVCPWCFVGKKNLEKAIASSKDQYNFEVPPLSLSLSKFQCQFIVIYSIRFCRLNGIHISLILLPLKKGWTKKIITGKSLGLDLNKFMLGCHRFLRALGWNTTCQDSRKLNYIYSLFMNPLHWRG